MIYHQTPAEYWAAGAARQPAHKPIPDQGGHHMSAGIIFIGGISGVFLGMGVIYLSIRITAKVMDRVSKTPEEGSK